MQSLKKLSAVAALGARSSSATAGGHGGGADFWKKLFYFGGLPAIGLGMINVYVNLEEPQRPEFIAYDYLRVRNKRFPWGDGNKSFFHNPHVNALPDGYEETDHH
ncbi:cytochrome c oxidase subunit 6A levy [Arctopsyche grandis]|uniref:cytochrome c oxidase subunit 6A levy n=1 Tax=Arctopsyche grandis TaxID=121162 RepID=UPI00406D854B